MKCELLAGMLKSLFGGNDMRKWGKVMKNSDLGGKSCVERPPWGQATTWHEGK